MGEQRDNLTASNQQLIDQVGQLNDANTSLQSALDQAQSSAADLKVEIEQAKQRDAQQGDKFKVLPPDCALCCIVSPVNDLYSFIC